MNVALRILGRVVKFTLFLTFAFLAFVCEVLAEMFKALKGALQNY